MKEYTIYESNNDRKALLINEVDLLNGKPDKIVNYTFDCEPDDIDTAYSALAEHIYFPTKDEKLKDQYQAEIENLKDDNVKALLEDAKKHEFISDYDVDDAEE